MKPFKVVYRIEITGKSLQLGKAKQTLLEHSIDEVVDCFVDAMKTTIANENEELVIVVKHLKNRPASPK